MLICQTTGDVTVAKAWPITASQRIEGVAKPNEMTFFFYFHHERDERAEQLMLSTNVYKFYISVIDILSLFIYKWK